MCQGGTTDNPMRLKLCSGSEVRVWRGAMCVKVREEVA